MVMLSSSLSRNSSGNTLLIWNEQNKLLRSQDPQVFPINDQQKAGVHSLAFPPSNAPAAEKDLPPRGAASSLAVASFSPALLSSIP